MQTVRLSNWGNKNNRKARKPSISERRKSRQICMEEAEWKMRPRFKFVTALMQGKQGWPKLRRRTLEMIAIQPCAEQSQTELEFEKQEKAFKSIPASELARYQGQFVAVRNGEIVDSDYDSIELSRRFFERYGGVPFYKTLIGEPMVINIPAPFLR